MNTPQPNSQVLQEATRFLIELNSDEPDFTTRQEFDAWLRASPIHVRAYLELLQTWESGAALPADRSVQLDELIAMGRADERNVVSLLDSGRNPRGPQSPGGSDDKNQEEFSDDQRKLSRDLKKFSDEQKGFSGEQGKLSGEQGKFNGGVGSGAPSRPAIEGLPLGPNTQHPGAHSRLPTVHRATRRIIAIAASVVIAVACATTWYLTQRDAYDTGIGEQRLLTLRDGSTINLNAHSRVRVRYSDRERRIELLEGQALFNVAPDAARPFRVRAGQTTVQALGTQFDVYKRAKGTAGSASTTVTVIEGVVAVDDRSSPRHEGLGDLVDRFIDSTPAGSRRAPPADRITLAAGQQLVIAPATVSTPKLVNTENATAWTERRLVFDGAPLAEVVDEFNRYNARQLVLRDAALSSLPISAKFSTPDPAPLLKFLIAQPHVVVEEGRDEIVIASRP